MVESAHDIQQPQSLLCLMGIGGRPPNKQIVNFAKLTLLASSPVYTEMYQVLFHS